MSVEAADPAGTLHVFILHDQETWTRDERFRLIGQKLV